MKAIKRLKHFIRVYLILARYGLTSLFLLLQIFSSRITKYINPRNWFQKKRITSKTTTSLFFKLSQVLLKPDKIQTLTEELNHLTNKLSTASTKKSEIIIEPNKEQSTDEPIGEIKNFSTEELGQQVKKLWNELNFSSEDLAHHLGSLLSKGKELKNQFTESIQMNMAEYIQEELRVFPSPEELNNFFNEIDDLSLDVRQLQVQVKQLMSSYEIN